MLKRFHAHQQGSSLVQFVILFPLVLLLIGLVLDGGWMYWQYRRADGMVNAAAQAASHAIDISYFRSTDQIRLDQGAAAAVARDFLDLNRRGNITQTTIRAGRDAISVDATARIPTIFLRLAGIPVLNVRVSGTAYPAYGINWEGQ